MSNANNERLSEPFLRAPLRSRIESLRQNSDGSNGGPRAGEMRKERTPEEKIHRGIPGSRQQSNPKSGRAGGAMNMIPSRVDTEEVMAVETPPENPSDFDEFNDNYPNWRYSDADKRARLEKLLETHQMGRHVEEKNLTE